MGHSLWGWFCPEYWLIISTAQCKTSVTPACQHWNYHSFSLSHQYMYKVLYWVYHCYYEFYQEGCDDHKPYRVLLAGIHPISNNNDDNLQKKYVNEIRYFGEQKLTDWLRINIKTNTNTNTFSKLSHPFFAYNTHVPLIQNDKMQYGLHRIYVDGLVHDCGNSIANALELPQSCTKLST